MVKNLPAMWETPVQYLGSEDALEEEMAPTPVLSPGESHGQRRLLGYIHGTAEVDTTEVTNTQPVHWL